MVGCDHYPGGVGGGLDVIIISQAVWGAGWLYDNVLVNNYPTKLLINNYPT